jgi:predicted phage tail protein
MTKDIEDVIREHYCAQDGTWLVEKGRVKEAKMLKESVARIEYYKHEAKSNWRLYQDACQRARDAEANVREREAALDKREKQMLSSLDELERRIALSRADLNK